MVGAIGTIRDHYLWDDAQAVDGIDTPCTSCKIITIPAHTRGKERNSTIRKPPEEIQVDTVPNPESNRISFESKFNYFLILQKYKKNITYLIRYRIRISI